MKNKKVLLGMFSMVLAAGFVFVSCASTSPGSSFIESDVVIPDGAVTISTEEKDYDAGDIEDMWYRDYHYEATKPALNPFDPRTMFNVPTESVYEYATANLERYTTKAEVSKVSRIITDDSTTVIYQTRKGVITEVYSHTNTDGAYPLRPDSNLDRFRKYRKGLLEKIED
jgi:hypothetical protein